MAVPYAVKDVDLLNTCHQVEVKQKRSPFSGNKFEVRMMNKQVLFKLEDEESVFQLLDNVNVAAYNTQGRKVFSMRRPATFPLDKMEVSVLDQVVAVIRQEMTLMKPVLYVNDPQEKHLYRIKGTVNAWDFKIQTLNKQTIGSIELMMTFFTRDKYCITFPPNMSVVMKMVMIGATILIDYAYHRKS